MSREGENLFSIFPQADKKSDARTRHNELKRGKKSILTGQCMHCLPQRLKSMLFFSGGSPKETRNEEKISKNLDFFRL